MGWLAQSRAPPLMATPFPHRPARAGRDVVGALPQLAGEERGEEDGQPSGEEEREPHPELTGHERRRERDEPGHERRVIEVAGRWAEGPEPVVRLVGVEVRAGEGERAQHRRAGGERGGDCDGAASGARHARMVVHRTSFVLRVAAGSRHCGGLPRGGGAPTNAG